MCSLLSKGIPARLLQEIWAFLRGLKFSRNFDKTPGMLRPAEMLPDPRASFPSTHWSVVTAAGKIDSDPQEAHAALTQLCQTYWPPLYSFVRSRGYSTHDAQDVTQSFFVFLIERKIYTRVDRQKGKFRSFLLASIKNFLADDFDRNRALKRGGGSEFIVFNEMRIEEAESSFQAQIVANHVPDEDRVFEQTWAQTLVRDALESLSRHYQGSGKEGVFRKLKVFLTGGVDPLPSYPELALQLGIQESTLRSDITRLRSRYRDALRAEVRRTVAQEGEVEGELRELLRILTTA
ncbi:MAG TPA: sigma-70 family RNA polymerase sigma factor [Chthoniobacterales bacterium]|nr:sigma-70 family RNA polymerase sigma factor [Chthoniobacterales bacterium]